MNPLKTFSVKQVAEFLGTNPETVRRWIRDGKLQAIQLSRKSGNQISEADLECFLTRTPKYYNRAGTISVASATLGMVPFTGIMIAAIAKYYSSKKASTRIRTEDFKAFLEESILTDRTLLLQKENLIKQTQIEMTELKERLGQYQYLLEHESLITESIRQTPADLIPIKEGSKDGMGLC